MEWILSGMWKRQITSAKLLRKLPGMPSVYVNKTLEMMCYVGTCTKLWKVILAMLCLSVCPSKWSRIDFCEILNSGGEFYQNLLIKFKFD